jgi:hypothetical protein
MTVDEWQGGEVEVSEPPRKTLVAEAELSPRRSLRLVSMLAAIGNLAEQVAYSV